MFADNTGDELPEKIRTLAEGAELDHVEAALPDQFQRPTVQTSSLHQTRASHSGLPHAQENQTLGDASHYRPDLERCSLVREHERRIQAAPFSFVTTATAFDKGRTNIRS